MNKHVKQVYDIWTTANKSPNFFCKDKAIADMANYIHSHLHEFDDSKLTQEESQIMHKLGNCTEIDIKIIKQLMKCN